MKWLFCVLCVLALGACASNQVRDDAVELRAVKLSKETGPLRLALIGMTHGHVEGPLWQARDRDDLEIVGVYEPNRALFDRLAEKYGLDDSLYYDDLDRMLDETEPEAASVMGSIADHVPAIEACAPRGIHALVEKPLAFRAEDAFRMQSLAMQHGVLVLTNYETSWYASVREAKRLVESGEMSPVRRMVFRHGHKGPKEIGVYPEFLDWLTDAEANGGGAIVDFGCYGAILAAWLTGEMPETVSADARRLKPEIYPAVDDDATIVLGFSDSTAVIQASWAWTHDNKEMDLHTESGSIHAGKWDELSIRQPDRPLSRRAAPPKPSHLNDEWTYLRQVVRGECDVDALSSLDLNVKAVRILDAARESAATGRVVRIAP